MKDLIKKLLRENTNQLKFNKIEVELFTSSEGTSTDYESGSSSSSSYQTPKDKRVKIRITPIIDLTHKYDRNKSQAVTKHGEEYDIFFDYDNIDLSGIVKFYSSDNGANTVVLCQEGILTYESNSDADCDGSLYIFTGNFIPNSKISEWEKIKEFIKGSRISGYKNQSVSQMLGSMYQNINVYDNTIPIFNVAFISPIASDAPLFYRYQLTDTQSFNGRTCFHVAFTPKRSGEHTFNGDMWVHDTDYALQKINMIVGKEQHINWVNKVTLMQEFTCFEDTLWFLTKDKFYVDFLPPHGDKIAGFLGRKTTTYKHIVVNNTHISDVVNDKKNKDDLEIGKDALNRNEDYWNQVRHDSLSKNEKSIYKMIDTIQGLPIYKKYFLF